jgi:cobalt/nickel transport system permease protein
VPFVARKIHPKRLKLSIAFEVTRKVGMHISEGVLSGPVLISGGALAVAGTAIGLKKLDYDRIAKAGILSAAFFVASLIHVPIGPSNAHLILNGLVGLLLGWAAFPAILVALVLQAMLFQYGGITALGVNTIIMALPAVLCYAICSPFLHKKPALMLSAAFACGFLSVALSALILGLALVFTEENFFEVSAIVIGAHIPVMIIEGLVTALCVAFLKKVQPTMLPGFSGK